VASTVERTGIKIYNDRSKYNEWEFIYDFGKDRTGMGQLAAKWGLPTPRLATGGKLPHPDLGRHRARGEQGGFGKHKASARKAACPRRPRWRPIRAALDERLRRHQAA